MKVPNNHYAFVDGSFNQKTKTYGYGGFLVDQHGRKHILQGSGNDPEMAAMRNVAGEILGSEMAIRKAMSLKMKRLMIFHDYEGVAKWPLGLWKAKKKGTFEYASFVKDAMRKGLKISFTHVKGHSGMSLNDEADQLAKLAVKLL